MAENSKIEWCDMTFNPWIGCQKVSEGCQHCYAEQLMDKRYGRVKWGPTGTRQRTSEANWRKPLQWNKHPWYQCSGCGWRGPVPDWDPWNDGCARCRNGLLRSTRCRVFCASLADVFEDRRDKDALNLWRAQLWYLIEQTPSLDWLLLTKRPENIRHMTLDHWWESWPDHVWIGTSVENQAAADERIPHLLRVPAQVRFLSCEPLLGPIDFRKVPEFNRIGLSLSGWWVIVGGESGHNARPMHPDWARSLVQQCSFAGVPVFVKQMGSVYMGGKGKGGDLDSIPEDLRFREFPLGFSGHSVRARVPALGRRDAPLQN